VFVSGVLTGRLLETEREANQERAFSNIIMGATGHDRRAVVNPPPHITLSLDQVRQLGNGFLEDRNHAVREAVHIAHTEMKEKHDEIVRKLKESLQKEKASRTEAEDVLKTVNNEANNHVAERIRLSAENVQLREQLSHRADIEITSQHVIRLSAENEDLKIKLEERDDEIEYLRKHLSPTPSRKKKSKDEDALKEKIASLNEELEYQKKRAARSIAALKEASVRSLRLLQSQRIED
jgi:predicted phage tail protein